MNNDRSLIQGDATEVQRVKDLLATYGTREPDMNRAVLSVATGRTLLAEIERLRELVAHASRSDLMSDRCDACREIREVVASL